MADISEIKLLEEQLLQEVYVKKQIDIMNKLSFTLLDFDLNRSMDICRQVIELSTSENFPEAPYQRGYLHARTILCNSYVISGAYTQATELTRELFPALENRNDYPDLYVYLLFIYSSLLYFASEYAEAQINAFKAYESAKEIGHNQFQAWAADIIAWTYEYQKDFESAHSYYRKALALHPEDENWEALINNNIAISYIESEEYDIALEYAEKSLLISEKNNLNRLIPSVLDTVANILKHQKCYNKALIISNRSLNMAKRLGMENDRLDSLVNIGSIYNRINDDRALEYLTEAAVIATRLGTKSIEKECLLGLSEYYERKKDYKLSLENYKRYMQIEKEILIKSNDKRILSLNAIHETKLLRQHLQEKDTLIREIHHRVKNNLNMVSSLIHLKNAESGIKIDLSDLENQINAIGLVHDKLYHSSELTEIDFRQYIQEILDTIFSLIPGMEIEIQNKIENIMLPAQFSMNLGLIINETAVNAIKHGFSSSAKNIYSIQFEKTDHYTLTISNSKDLFRDDSQTTCNCGSIGLNLIENLVEQLEGDFTITDDDNYTVNITLPFL